MQLEDLGKACANRIKGGKAPANRIKGGFMLLCSRCVIRTLAIVIQGFWEGSEGPRAAITTNLCFT